MVICLFLCFKYQELIQFFEIGLTELLVNWDEMCLGRGFFNSVLNLTRISLIDTNIYSNGI